MMFKKIKTWKTVIQFIITVLTAVVSSFLTQSCMNCHTDLTDLTDALCYNFGHTDLTDPSDLEYDTMDSFVHVFLAKIN